MDTLGMGTGQLQLGLLHFPGRFPGRMSRHRIEWGGGVEHPAGLALPAIARPLSAVMRVFTERSLFPTPMKRIDIPKDAMETELTTPFYPYV
jgi:hypothetical protein